MLPRVNVIVPTDEFYELSVDEARDLNEDGNGDPIMGEDFERARGPNDDGATFRIRSYAADGTTPVYQYYIAQHLWQWARRGNRTDPTRAPWRYSDWMALRNQFEPNYPIPNWVRELESADLRVVHNGGTQTWYWNDNYTPPRLVRKEYDQGKTVHYGWSQTSQRYYRTKVTYDARWGNPNVVGSTEYYQFYYQPDPAKQNYDADTNWSQLIQWINPGKWRRHYTGTSGEEERLDRIYWFSTGETWRYGHNSLTRRGKEYLVEKTFDVTSPASGQKWFYDGDEPGEGRLGKVIHPNGQIDIYEGQAGYEHKVSSWYRDNSGGTGQMVTLEFVGPKGREKLKGISAWGMYHTLTGSQTGPERGADDDDDMSTDDEGDGSDDGDDGNDSVSA
jgi:hypothetical protein